MRVQSTEQLSGVNDLESPLKLGYLCRAKGFENQFGEALISSIRYASQLERLVFIQLLALQLVSESAKSEPEKEESRHRELSFRVFASPQPEGNPIREMAVKLAKSGLVPIETLHEAQRSQVNYREVTEAFMQEIKAKGNVSHLLSDIIRASASSLSTSDTWGRLELEHSVMRSFEELLQHTPVCREWLKEPEHRVDIWRSLLGKR
jgi:hypothetical protein